MDPYTKELYEDINGKCRLVVSDKNVPDLQWQFAKEHRIEPTDENAKSYTVTIDLILDESYPLVKQGSFSIIKVVELPGLNHRKRDVDVTVIINDQTSKKDPRKGKGKMRAIHAHRPPKPIKKE